MCVYVCVPARARFSSFLKQITRYAIENRTISLDLNVKSFEKAHRHTHACLMWWTFCFTFYSLIQFFPCCCSHKIVKRRGKKSATDLSFEDMRRWAHLKIEIERGKIHSMPIQVDDKRILGANTRPHTHNHTFDQNHFATLLLKSFPISFCAFYFDKMSNCAQVNFETVHVNLLVK